MNIRYLIVVLSLIVVEANADNSTLDAAIGGGIGGATGAALGGAVGTAVTTDEDHHYHSTPAKTYYRNVPVYEHHGSGFCPPGQAKKGRC